MLNELHELGKKITAQWRKAEKKGLTVDEFMETFRSQIVENPKKEEHEGEVHAAMKLLVNGRIVDVYYWNLSNSWSARVW